MTPKARERRFTRLKEHGCIACFKRGWLNVAPDIHHLNKDGKAGRERRGDEFTIPLCKWHHVGQMIGGRTELWLLNNLGPSLAKQSKAFRRAFGSDDELLAEVNDRIRMMDELAGVA